MKKIRRIFFIFIIFSIITGCSNKKTELKKSDNNISVVATSAAIIEIMDKLDYQLEGVSESKIYELPKKYKNSQKVGFPMNPDIEKIKMIDPDYVFSPVSLIADLKPKYDNAGINYGFVNLNNIPGMYKSILDIGNLLNRKKEAEMLYKDYEDFISDYKSKNKVKGEGPSVLILMGLPGSYLAATENSYVGSLVKLAGGRNVYRDGNEQFINVNPEDMLEKNPDIILRTSHAMPEDVMKMFKKEFMENNIWKHFKAVKENKVFDLDYRKFGMSAKFNYKEALEELGEIMYEK